MFDPSDATMPFTPPKASTVFGPSFSICQSNRASFFDAVGAPRSSGVHLNRSGV